jgi:hypothetical protein
VRFSKSARKVPSQSRALGAILSMLCASFSLATSFSVRWSRHLEADNLSDGGRNITLPGILSQENCRILYRITSTVVIEISPDAVCSACPDTFGPDCQLFSGIVVSVPLAHAVEADINILSCLDQLIRKIRTAARAKNSAGLTEASKNKQDSTNCRGGTPRRCASCAQAGSKWTLDAQACNGS